MKKTFLTLAIIFTIAIPALVFAKGLRDAKTVLESVGGASGADIGVAGDLPSAISSVIRTVLSLVGTIFLVLTIYAGIMWMTAQGEEEKVTKAKGILTTAVVGLIIIMSAYAITYFVTSNLTKISGPSSPQADNNPAEPVPPGGPDVMGCCDNQAVVGQKLASPERLCRGFQEQWAPGPCP